MIWVNDIKDSKLDYDTYYNLRSNITKPTIFESDIILNDQKIIQFLLTLADLCFNVDFDKRPSFNEILKLFDDFLYDNLFHKKKKNYIKFDDSLSNNLLE